jgi:hypothetical protein
VAPERLQTVLALEVQEPWPAGNRTSETKSDPAHVTGESPVGRPRIQAELALLGHNVAESTVAKYMVRRRSGPPSQTWRSFLKNHMDCTAACDFFVVPTATFRLLYCFVILAHGRRRIVHFNVTNHPCAGPAILWLRSIIANLLSKRRLP